MIRYLMEMSSAVFLRCHCPLKKMMHPDRSQLGRLNHWGMGGGDLDLKHFEVLSQPVTKSNVMDSWIMKKSPNNCNHCDYKSPSACIMRSHMKECHLVYTLCSTESGGVFRKFQKGISEFESKFYSEGWSSWSKKMRYLG